MKKHSRVKWFSLAGRKKTEVEKKSVYFGRYHHVVYRVEKAHMPEGERQKL